MFFSGKELHQYAQRDPNARHSVMSYASSWGFEPHSSRVPSLDSCKKIVARAVELAINRDSGRGGIGKWMRPWTVVEKLRNFRPPQGDYGIGIEVEMGFRHAAHASFIARRLASWQYVTCDNEGGPNGMEITMPPVLYSKFGKNSKAWKYISLLAKNKDWLHPHHPSACVGTHVNVSTATPMRTDRVGRATELLYFSLGSIGAGTCVNSAECDRYFNRIPYGSIRSRGNNTYVEMKLFDSKADVKALRKYVEVAVSIVKLIESDAPLTPESMRQALERGYLLACQKSGIKPEPHPDPRRLGIVNEVVQVTADADDTDFSVAA